MDLILLLYAFIVINIIVIIEIFCEGFKTYYRPSLILVTIAYYLRKLFEKLGGFFAWVSSLIDYKIIREYIDKIYKNICEFIKKIYKNICEFIKKIYENIKKIYKNICEFLNNIYETICNIIKDILDIINNAIMKLIEPGIDILFSWVYFFKGYYDYVKKNIPLPQNRNLIYITSFIIVSIIFIIITWVFDINIEIILIIILIIFFIMSLIIINDLLLKYGIISIEKKEA